MATMNVSLPDALKAWAEAQTQAGMYDTTSDYVRDLIRRDRERSASIAEFRTLINEGLNSAISTLTMDQIWDQEIASTEQSRKPNG